MVSATFFHIAHWEVHPINWISGFEVILFFLQLNAKPATIHVLEDHATIQAAIVAAALADESIVSTGTYRENVQFSGKNISLRLANPLSTSIVATTILDGRTACVG